MSEQKIPNEIWVDKMGLASVEPYDQLIQAKASNMRQNKYLSEQSVKDLLDEKDKEMQMRVDYYEDKCEMLITLGFEKDKEIEKIISVLMLGKDLIKEWCTAFDAISDNRDEDFLIKANEIINNHSL